MWQRTIRARSSDSSRGHGRRARPAAASPRRHTFQLARIGKRRTPARRAVPGSTWRRRRIRRKRVFGRAQRFWIALRNRRQGIRCESEDVVHRVGCERRGRRGLGHQHRIRVSWRLSWRHQRPPHIPKHQLANLPERDANRGLHRATDHVVMDAGEVRTLLRRVQFRPQLGVDLHARVQHRRRRVLQVMGYNAGTATFHGDMYVNAIAWLTK